MPEASQTFVVSVNGGIRPIVASPSTALLYILRNDCEMNGPKYGCGLGECGSCTVLIDGVAARSCVVPIKIIGGREVTTLEGLCRDGQLGLVQQAFLDAQAAQCGYCINGMIMTAHALLMRNAAPSDAEIRRELDCNLCRCGTHYEILQAVKLAADRLFAQQQK